jgi:ketosteroid isomerase-like protein
MCCPTNKVYFYQAKKQRSNNSYAMKNTMIILISAAVTFGSGCTSKEADPGLLLEVEKAFSEMSVQQGMKAAFLHFSDDSAVLLRPNTMPVVGKNALAEAYSGLDDSQFTLSWEPLNANIATSGDLGYTYGIYTMTPQVDSIPESKGTYVTIWKKNAAGEWRFMLDTGQQGLGNSPSLPGVSGSRTSRIGITMLFFSNFKAQSILQIIEVAFCLNG